MGFLDEHELYITVKIIKRHNESLTIKVIF